MTDIGSRLPLREFLVGLSSRTGDPLESAAMAEMSGYSIADAQADGWPDIFAAVHAVKPNVDRGWTGVTHGPPHPSRTALMRGLTYTLPVIALWSIFPRPITTAEIWFLAALVALSWGGSMASSHVVGSWIPGDAARAWRIAAAVASSALIASAIAGAVLVNAGTIRGAVMLVGSIQVLYFFSASPLMLRRHNPGLGAAAIVGAVAGLGAMAATLQITDAVPADYAQWLQKVAGACLLTPAILLAVQSTRGSTGTNIPGYTVHVLPRDVLAFGAYGVMFGCLVLWVPIVNPSSPAAILNLVVIGGIAGAEVAVTRMRQRTDRLLAQPFDDRSFAPRARHRIVGAVLFYVVPVGLATIGLAIVVNDMWAPGATLILSGITVICLGGIQVLSLIGMSLHGIRQVAMAITTCTLALMALTPFLARSGDLIDLYLTVLVVLAAALFVTVLRLGSHPINFI